MARSTIILMGVSGCGKTMVGKSLAGKLGCKFCDGDDFHPQANLDKMAEGIPLMDEDRMPWLEQLRDLIAEEFRKEQPLVLACSALKARYRDVLTEGNPGVVFVHLDGSYETILGRMQSREGHFMKAEMLQSQFAILERPQNGVRIDIGHSIDEIVDEIIGGLNLG